MTPFYVYKSNNDIRYSAKQVIENSDKLFLIESNKPVGDNDIVPLGENLYDIANNDFYVMVVIDKATKDITASYGIFSYCHSLYYYKTGANLHINISLHDLLNDIKIPLTLDLFSANEFVRYGFVEGDKTLINEIKKVPSLKTVTFRGETIESVNSKYTERESKGDYVDNLRAFLPSTDTKILIPLSGGFDSTLLAYLMKDYGNKFAVTVGSKDDPTSEFRNADITASYLQIPQEKIYSNEEWIESLPTIVDVMEGEMFDPGVFLIYFLVNRIKSLGLTDYVFISGDGADQILNKNFFTEDLDNPPSLNRYDSVFWPKNPKHCLYFLVVKKLEWLLRLNDIDYIMPFNSKELCNCSIKNIFSEQKREYKEFVKSYLPKEIGSPLRKRGGLVDERYFINPRTRRILLDVLDNPKYRAWFDTENINDMNLRNVTYRMYVILFNYIFIEGGNIDLGFEEILARIKHE